MAVDRQLIVTERLVRVFDMKDHKKVQKAVYLDGDMSLEVLVTDLLEAGHGLVNATVRRSFSSWDGDLIVSGWRPLTEAELERAEKRRAAARERAAAKRASKQQGELAQLKKLAAKYGKKVVEDD